MNRERIFGTTREDIMNVAEKYLKSNDNSSSATAIFGPAESTEMDSIEGWKRVNVMDGE